MVPTRTAIGVARRNITHACAGKSAPVFNIEHAFTMKPVVERADAVVLVRSLSGKGYSLLYIDKGSEKINVIVEPLTAGNEDNLYAAFASMFVAKGFLRITPPPILVTDIHSSVISSSHQIVFAPKRIRFGNIEVRGKKAAVISERVRTIAALQKILSTTTYIEHAEVTDTEPLTKVLVGGKDVVSKLGSEEIVKIVTAVWYIPEKLYIDENGVFRVYGLPLATVVNKVFPLISMKYISKTGVVGDYLDAIYRRIAQLISRRYGVSAEGGEGYIKIGQCCSLHYLEFEGGQVYSSLAELIANAVKPRIFSPEESTGTVLVMDGLDRDIMKLIIAKELGCRVRNGKAYCDVGAVIDKYGEVVLSLLKIVRGNGLLGFDRERLKLVVDGRLLHSELLETVIDTFIRELRHSGEIGEHDQLYVSPLMTIAKLENTVFSISGINITDGGVDFDEDALIIVREPVRAVYYIYNGKIPVLLYREGAVPDIPKPSEIIAYMIAAKRKPRERAVFEHRTFIVRGESAEILKAVLEAQKGLPDTLGDAIWGPLPVDPTSLDDDVLVLLGRLTVERETGKRVVRAELGDDGEILLNGIPLKRLTTILNNSADLMMAVSVVLNRDFISLIEEARESALKGIGAEISPPVSEGIEFSSNGVVTNKDELRYAAIASVAGALLDVDTYYDTSRAAIIMKPLPEIVDVPNTLKEWFSLVPIAHKHGCEISYPHIICSPPSFLGVVKEYLPTRDYAPAMEGVLMYVLGDTVFEKLTKKRGAEKIVFGDEFWDIKADGEMLDDLLTVLWYDLEWLRQSLPIEDIVRVLEVAGTLKKFLY